MASTLGRFFDYLDGLCGRPVLSELQSQLGQLAEQQIRVERQVAFKDGLAARFAEQVRGAKAGDKKVVDIRLSTAVADESLRTSDLFAKS